MVNLIAGCVDKLTQMELLAMPDLNLERRVTHMKARENAQKKGAP